MFCVNCGSEFKDNSKFCSSCGNVLVPPNSDSNFKIKAESQVKLVPAKCTGCGASLVVNSRERAAICPYCNNAYIVEQAINNYNIKMDGNLHVGSATINVNGVNVDNLLVRAKDFASKGAFKSALDYYNQVLDINFNMQEARDGIIEMKNAIDNYIYFRSDASMGLSPGVLQLKKNRLVYLSNKGKENVYYLDQITKLSKPLTSIHIEYHKKFTVVIINFKLGLNKQWFDIIISAMNGKYPEVEYC